MALTKMYTAMFRIAGMQIGTVTRPNVRQNGTFSEAETDSNSGSICFKAVTAVICAVV